MLPNQQIVTNANIANNVEHHLDFFSTRQLSADYLHLGHGVDNLKCIINLCRLDIISFSYTDIISEIINTLLYYIHFLCFLCILTVILSTTSQGFTMIYHAGYKFIKRSYIAKLTNRIRWECTMYNRRRCPARIHTIGDEVVLLENVHSHEPLIFNNVRGTSLKLPLDMQFQT